MPTYRRATVADSPAIVSAWNLRGVTQSRNLGYAVEPMTEALCAAEIASPRERWYLAFDNSGNLRAFIQGIGSKMGDNIAWPSRFYVDPRISLASVRNHRDEIMRLLLQAIPDTYTLVFTEIRPLATVANEWTLKCRNVEPWASEPTVLKYWDAVSYLRTVA